MTSSTETPARIARYAMSFPAISLSDDWTDRVVTQGHADYCQEFGHATYTKEGVDQGFCPRCGDVTETPAAVIVDDFAPFHHAASYQAVGPDGARGHMTGLNQWSGARSGYFEARCNSCRWTGPTHYVTQEGVHTARGFAKGEVVEGVVPGTKADLLALVDAEALAHIMNAR